MSHNYSSFTFTSNNDNSLINYSDDDEEDIEELLRRNDFLSDTANQSRSIQQPQQHVVVTPPKKAAKAEWNDHFENTQVQVTTNTTLPPALLKLDQQHAIPTLRHCNDILVEIEACTIEPRRCMIRSGVRGGGGGSGGDGRKQRDIAATKEDGHEQQQEQLMEVVTTSVDCIGRVVQLAEHNTTTPQQRQQKIHHDIQINDRIAAIHPFEYKLDKKNQLLLSRQHAHNHSSSSYHQRYTLVDAGHTVKLPSQGPNNDNFLEAASTHSHQTTYP